MFFLNVCENPDILRIIHLIYKILDFVFLIIPMGLIIMITIDLVKSVIGDEKSVKENNKRIITRIIFAIALFFVPTIVTIVMNTLNTIGITSEYTTCIENAKSIEKINVFQTIYDANKEQSKKQNNNLSSNTYSNLADKMVNVATKEIGTKEGNNNSNKYGKALGKDNLEWCGIFVTWVAKNTTVNNVNLYDNIINKNNSFGDNYTSTGATLLHFHTNDNLDFHYSQKYGGTYIPKKGDYIFFGNEKTWNKNLNLADIKEVSKHTGMVIEVKDGQIYTIEGNTGKGEVKKKQYKLNNSTIMGYGSWYN